MTISIAIPTYGYNGKGADVLDFSFAQIAKQVYKDFDVIISDDSEDNSIYKVCKKWEKEFEIRYFINAFKRGPASNANSAISRAPSEVVKFLCQDDYLYSEYSLKAIAESFSEDTKWMFTTYAHTKDRANFYRVYHPTMNPNIELVNTLGTPSGLTFRKDRNNPPQFDTSLRYHYDCDFYRQMYSKYGNPKIITPLTMINYVWDESITSSLTAEEYEHEVSYLQNKWRKN